MAWAGWDDTGQSRERLTVQAPGSAKRVSTWKPCMVEN